MLRSDQQPSYDSRDWPGRSIQGRHVTSEHQTCLPYSSRHSCLGHFPLNVNDHLSKAKHTTRTLDRGFCLGFLGWKVSVFRLEGLRELSGVDGTHVRRRKLPYSSSPP